MITFEKISKFYGDNHLFDDASFSIYEGEKCGLVGRNGSGKTTLMRFIVGIEELDKGNIFIPKNYRIGYLQQHISFKESTIIQEACLGLKKEDESSVYKAETILSGLGFSLDQMENSPQTLSGGYQLRLHLAKVLLSDPDFLILDEPTNYLDIPSQLWLRKFLSEWKKELLLISHDREFMDSITTHTLAIHRKKIKKIKGNTENIFSQILQEEMIHEKTRVKLDQKKEKAEAFAKRFGAKATKAKQAQSKLKAVEKLPSLQKLAQLDDLDFNFNESEFPGKVLLKCEDISFSYNPQEPLIQNISLEIQKGDCVAIIGKNGYGKSTLLKILSKELTPQQGVVNHSPHFKLGYFGQTNIERLSPSQTIESEIASANPSLSFSEVRALCGAMMFSSDLAKKQISVLSGGEKSRVMLGKILATPSNILFLDEPTHHLDMESIEALIEAIHNFSGAVVIVTHSEMILQKLPLTHVIACQKNQQKVLLGNYNDFLEKIGWSQELPTIKKDKSLSKSDSKKQIHNLEQEKNKLLKNLQKKISSIEEDISCAEDLLKQTQELLNQASDNHNIHDTLLYSQKCTQIENNIDTLFEQLEQLSQELTNKKIEFDDKITSLHNELA